MKDKGSRPQRAFIPSNPQDKHRSQIEIMNWQAELEAEKKQDNRETRRFIVTPVISSIAAVGAVVAAVVSVLSYLR